jgi:hypothetical protein
MEMSADERIPSRLPQAAVVAFSDNLEERLLGHPVAI